MGPIGEQIYGWILSDGFAGGIKEVRGLVRGHSCIVGNAIHYLCKLGFADGRIQDLVDMLLRMQWDDGGWNCDRKPAAHSSSFNSTAIAVRGLVTYKRTCNSASVDAHIARGIAFLVDRQLCKRKSTNEIAHQDFMKLFFPEYYHYSYLYGLKVVAESGHGHVEQLDFALDCLNNQKTALGWSAGKKYYWKSKAERAGRSLISWETAKGGGVNDFITLDALKVLRHFGKAGASDGNPQRSGHGI